jgi:hypothetical protein
MSVNQVRSLACDNNHTSSTSTVTVTANCQYLEHNSSIASGSALRKNKAFAIQDKVHQISSHIRSNSGSRAKQPVGNHRKQSSLSNPRTDSRQNLLATSKSQTHVKASRQPIGHYHNTKPNFGANFRNQSPLIIIADNELMR